MKKLIEPIVFSNIFIGLAGLCMLWVTELVALDEFKLDALELLVFGATMSAYGLMRLLALRERKIQESTLLQWDARNQWVLWVLVVVGIGLCVPGLLQLSWPSLIAFGIGGLLTFTYSIPWLPGARRLRDIGFFKTLLVATVWAILTALVPLLEAEGVHWLNTGLMTVERFLFILAITLPFDIRDLEFDRKAGLNTIPMRIGVEKTIKLARYLLLAFSALCFVHLLVLDFMGWGEVLNIGHPLMTFYFIVLFLSSSVANRLVHRTHQAKPELWFTFGLDGTMILQFLLVVAVHLIFGSA